MQISCQHQKAWYGGCNVVPVIRRWSDWQLFGKFSQILALRLHTSKFCRLIHVIVAMLAA